MKTFYIYNNCEYPTVEETIDAIYSDINIDDLAGTFARMGSFSKIWEKLPKSLRDEIFEKTMVYIFENEVAFYEK